MNFYVYIRLFVYCFITICCVCYMSFYLCCFFFFKQKTAYEMRISDWSSDVCSSDLLGLRNAGREPVPGRSVDAAPARRRTVPALAAGRSARRAEATSQGSDRWSLQPHPLPRSMDGSRERPMLQGSRSRRRRPVRGHVARSSRQERFTALPQHRRRLSRHARSEEHTSELQSI